MAGTNQKNPRCIALQGTIGEQVSCGMYELRSTSCKEVQVADAQCNKARIAHNMIPFMAGTNQKNPRCIALQGTIGEQVSCGMYELRSTS
ncbi:hypothetical protein, partial [Staphylococcus aureus]|uniref:hypothetical protein n=1 Tax=Staphylococcus aureus TaxID=1280 RepID=UPI001C52FD6F